MTLLPDFNTITGIRITRAPVYYQCGASWSADLQFQDFDIWHVLEGSGYFNVNGKHYGTAAGYTHVFTPGERLLAAHDSRNAFRVFACHFTADFSATATPRSFFAHCKCLPMRNSTLFREWAIQCSNLYHSINPHAKKQADLLLQLMLCQLWTEQALPARAEKDALIENLLTEIRLNPERTWTIQAMTRRCSLSSTYFYQRFRALAHMSPTQYVIHCRIEQAKILLQDSKMSQEQIADSLGYSDVYFFNRQFSRLVKVSPGTYRKKMA